MKSQSPSNINSVKKTEDFVKKNANAAKTTKKTSSKPTAKPVSKPKPSLAS